MEEELITTRWIPIKERKPMPNDDVLIVQSGKVKTGFISLLGVWFSHGENWAIDDVSHWMPFPNPPSDGVV